MTWETIDNLQPVKLSNQTPPMGVRVSCRTMIGRKKKDGSIMPDIKRIDIMIGAQLAEGAGMDIERQPVRLMLGSGNDTGKIAVMPNKTGPFTATGKPGGVRRICIGQLSAEGLFALEFESFTRDNLEVVKPVSGQPAYFAFLATGSMLDAD